MAWKWVLAGSAQRDLRKLSQIDRRRILDALDRLTADPTRSDIRKLQGKDDEWRLRVGSWRLRFFYESETSTVVVTRVLARKEAYRG